MSRRLYKRKDCKKRLRRFSRNTGIGIRPRKHKKLIKTQRPYKYVKKARRSKLIEKPIKRNKFKNDHHFHIFISIVQVVYCVDFMSRYS